MDTDAPIFDEELAQLAMEALSESDDNLQNVEFNDVKIEVKPEVAQSDAQEDVKQNDQNEGMYGKFKNPEELLKAYTELEREFTRRSQRLKELEKGTRPYESEEEWKDAADKFFEKTPSAKAFAKEMACEIAADPTLKQGRDCFEKALVRVMAKTYRTPEQLMADGQFLKEYVLGSEEVKRAVIEGYLKGIAGTQPPMTLPSGGQSAAAPARRPRTVKEAGDMLLKENK